MIDFAQPGYLALLAVVAAMAYGAYRLARWRSTARSEFAGPQARRWQSSAFWPRLVLLLIAASLVALAAARPQWGSNQSFREREGIDFVIALDISQSMSAADVEPSRLAVAQEELIRLVEAERGSRIGLVLFAGTAFLRSPLTSDTQAMVQLIRRSSQEAGLTRVGSDLGAALDVASVILSASEENRGRAVILVSDGEDFGGSFQGKAAALREQGIAVHTAGVGTAQGAGLFDRTPSGALIPKRDSSGAPIVTRLEAANLQAIAEAGGGHYEPMDNNSRSLLGLRVDLRRLDPTPIGAERLVIPIERFQLFVAAALVLLVAAWFLPAKVPLPRLPLLSRRSHPGLAMLLLALVIGACGDDSLQSKNRDANRLYTEGDYEGALLAYQELLAERPDIDQLSYNAGNALHRLGAYERAIAETQRALPPNEVGLGVSTYFALGNHLLQLDRFEEAYAAYRAALLLDPSDQDSKHNLELTLLLASGEQAPDDGQGPGPDEQGDSGDSGEGTPEPGEGTPGPGDGEGSPQPNASPGAAGAQATPQGTPGAADGSQRTLEEALAGIDEDLSFEEAIEILDLLRQEQQTPRQGPGSGPAGPDY